MLHFVANGASGRHRTQRVLKKIRAFCEAHNVDYTFHMTERPKHCTEIVRSLSAVGSNANIIILGGDGTFHEALNGVDDLAGTTLGFVPCGSGNDFVATFKESKRPLKKILNGIISNTTRRIDFIEFASGVRCLNVAGTGLDIEVLKKAVAFKRLTGKPNYVACLVRVLKNFNPYILTVTSNGKTITYNCIMAGVCNGRQFGGGIKLSPLSELDDGKLNLVIMKDIERKRIKWALPSFLSGRHLKKDYTVHEIIADSVQITNQANYKVELDGEIFSNLDFNASVRPSALNVFC